MTKEAAINAFWNSFGIKAFEENTVVDVDENGNEIEPQFPYITYQGITDSFDREVPGTANIWYRSTGWKAINAKTEEVSKKIGASGKKIAVDGGGIWIKRGKPFAQNMGDESDDLIKRKYINISIVFITQD
jgi:hypothetical protein